MNRDNTYLSGNKFACGSGPNQTSFKKGTVPWNKGKKGIRNSPATEFKKGQRGRNWLPVGSMSIRKDKNSASRRFIKISEPNIWKLFAVCVWEAEHGAIPRGLVLHHIDGDSLNDAVQNLCVLTRAAHITIHRLDLSRGKLERPKPAKQESFL